MSEHMDTPRKSTSMRRTRIVIVAVFAVIALAILMAGCGDETKKSDFWGGPGSSGVSGTVTDRHNTGNLHHLYIRDAAGNKYRVRVGFRPYLRCHKGDQYPACARKSGKR